MKKIAIFFLIIIIILAGIFCFYINYKVNYYEANKDNRELESYYEQEISGLELTTIINKVVDRNIKNQVQKDEKGKFINNNQNSIQIEVKMLDYDKLYSMEIFYDNGMNKFVQNYNKIKFKCTNIQYHKETNKIKYMLFEQITQ